MKKNTIILTLLVLAILATSADIQAKEKIPARVNHVEKTGDSTNGTTENKHSADYKQNRMPLGETNPLAGEYVEFRKELRNQMRMDARKAFGKKLSAYKHGI